MTQPMVSVVMITYAHEKYVKQAIEGILMQECDFDVELIIANDCSPDNTESVVKSFSNHPKYSWIKYTKHTTNKGMMPNFIWALQQSSGKYIALCEGDDYWTDSLKLQKQVDFLEKNPEYGLVHTNSVTLNHRTKKYIKRTGGLETVQELDKTQLFQALINGKYIVATLTAMFKTEYINQIQFEERFKMGDIPLWLQLSQLTKFKYINDVTSVYRAAFNSATRQVQKEKQLLFLVSSIEMRFFYLDMYKLSVSKEIIYKYRERLFKYKEFKIGSIIPTYLEYFTDNELEYLNSRPSFISYYIKKIVYSINNFKDNKIQIYYFLFQK